MDPGRCLERRAVLCKKGEHALWNHRRRLRERIWGDTQTVDLKPSKAFLECDHGRIALSKLGERPPVVDQLGAYLRDALAGPGVRLGVSGRETPVSDTNVTRSRQRRQVGQRRRDCGLIVDLSLDGRLTERPYLVDPGSNAARIQRLKPARGTVGDGSGLQIGQQLVVHFGRALGRRESARIIVAGPDASAGQPGGSPVANARCARKCRDVTLTQCFCRRVELGECGRSLLTHAGNGRELHQHLICPG